MKLFFQYLSQRKKEFLLLLGCSAVFATAFLLYHLPLQAVIYPVLLCIILEGSFIGIDFYHVRRKHLQLCNMQELTAAMIASLPHSEGVIETDYQALVQILQNENKTLVSNTDARYQNMVEYYTLWVHQVKTPIAAMRLNLQNQDTDLSRKLSADLSRIEQYVEMVLTFLRLDSNTTDYVLKEQALDPIIKQAVKKFASEFISRKIALQYEPVCQTVITDSKWLTFVVEQLLSNALKYTREGSIHIYMREPKTLCIQDTGIGIAPENLPRIFEKGYTGYNGRNDTKASGIGLYLCKRICSNLNINIEVSSLPGIGTTIMLHLEQYPLKKE